MIQRMPSKTWILFTDDAYTAKGSESMDPTMKENLMFLHWERVNRCASPSSFFTLIFMSLGESSNLERRLIRTVSTSIDTDADDVAVNAEASGGVWRL